MAPDQQIASLSHQSSSSSFGGVGGSNGGGQAHDDHRKQNHCEIEKRRRDKMNHYIMQLASAIPSFNGNQSKLDKSTVLRMAVQHVKSLRSSLCSFSSFHLRPSFLSSGNLLKNLVLQMASQEAQDNLFMVVTCDRGKVLFVSQSAKGILNHEQNELVGQSLFDILHKDDVSKVKEQISYFSLMPKEMLVDSKTLQPIKNNQRQSFIQLQNQQSNSTPQPGARRSFFCRMKSGRISNPNLDKNNQETSQPNTNCNINRSNLSLKDSNDTVLSTNSSSKQSKQANETTNDVKNDDIHKENDCHNKSDDDKRIKRTQQQLSAPQSSRSDKIKASIKSRETGADTKGKESLDVSDVDFSSTQVITKKISKIINEKAKAKRDDDNTIPIENKSSPDSGANSDSCSNSSGGSDEQTTCSETLSSLNNISASSSGISCGSRKTQRDGSYKISSSPGSGSDGCSSSDRNSGTETNSQNSLTSSRRKQWRYVVMHCTGYLKSITLKADECDDDDFDDCDDDNNDLDEEDGNRYKTVNCLVAVCRSIMDRDLKPDRPLTFTCRYSMEGKFVFVDQRTTIALGYTPQQLIGTSHYAYCHKDSVNTFKECHRQCILNSEAVSSDIYQFKRANGQHLWLQTSLKSFRNPWTKFIDYIVANHTTAEGNPHYNDGCVPTKFNQDMTGEASQSSSPASSSSISLPSVDSKKSASPSSSSIGSTYSMESYSSGGSIQALLNQIDRVKSGGIKYSLDLHKKRSEGHAKRSDGGSSARKSNEDSGNFSDLQSCSSVSSQNSALTAEFINANNFVNNVVQTVLGGTGGNGDSGSSTNGGNDNSTQSDATKQQPQLEQQRQQQLTEPKQPSNANLSNSFYQPTKIGTTFTHTQQSHNPSVAQTNYQESCQPVVCSPPTESSSQVENPAAGYSTPPIPTNRVNLQDTNQRSLNDDAEKGSGKGMAAARVGRSMIGSIKPNQRLAYNYPYRQSLTKPDRVNSLDNSPQFSDDNTTWVNSGAPIYSSNTSTSVNPGDNARQEMQAGQNVVKDTRALNQPVISSRVCNINVNQANQLSKMHSTVTGSQTNYVVQPNEPMNVMRAPQMSSQANNYASHIRSSYANESMQQVGSYMPTTNNVESSYSTDGMVVAHMSVGEEVQNELAMALDQQQQQQQQQQQHQFSHYHHQRQQQNHHHHHQHLQQGPTHQGQAHPHEGNLNVSMIWDAPPPPPNTIAYRNVNMMHDEQQASQQLVCHQQQQQQQHRAGHVSTMTNINMGHSNNQPMAIQQMVHCTQCINHRCCSNQSSMMANNNGDLNSMNLTSLAVEGDLDEVELLECLAACEPPESQLYNIQNNNYNQYNI